MRLPTNTDLPPSWPAGSVTHRVVYRVEVGAAGRILAELPFPLNRRAIALLSGDATPAEMELLSVPFENPEDAELIARVREWIAVGASAPQMITFQGAQLFWGAGRAAVIAPQSRLTALEVLLAELAYFELEIGAIEKSLGGFWPDLEADAGPAFELDERTHRNRKKLGERFRQLLGLRARLTRILPFVQTPHVYPPTLASQVSERLRERLRMEHRIEILRQQLDVFERIYDACGTRVSEFTASKKGHLLEMIIIVMLAAQTMLVLFEVLTIARN